MRKLIRWVLIPLLILAAAVFFGAPVFIGTDWVKERVKKGIEAETGRTAEVGDIGFSWINGLVVEDVVLKQKPDHAAHGDLFRIGELQLDVNLSSVLSETLEVSNFTAKGPKIVLVRNMDGTFNISDLMQKPSQPSGATRGQTPAPSAPAGGTNKPSDPSPTTPKALKVELEVTEGSLTYIDQRLGTKVSIEDLESTTRFDGGMMTVDANFTLNGGASHIVGEADLSKSPSPFVIKTIEIDGATMDTQLTSLGLFFPLLGEQAKSASGTLSFKLNDLSATGFDQASLTKSLTGSGSLKLNAGSLASGPIVQIAQALAALGAGDLNSVAQAAAGSNATRPLKVSAATGTFRIAQGRVHTDDFNLNGEGLDLALKGSTSLDGQLQYGIEVGALNRLLASNKKVLDVLGGKALPLQLTGTLASPKVAIDPTSAIQGTLKNLIGNQLKGKVPGEVEGVLKGLFGGK